ncbi:HTH-type transcriptional regulator Hpr [Priestia megaterium]|jgi:MarR family protease production transcriptional regulator HPr|nr:MULTISPECIES: HTH-type transcriptional regulator Hpr [Priestia]MBZ5483048.1 HTH-type transcriptional regulator Hpr [Bacillus sp. T_4]RFB32331.1 HTH-type transcriptional regulator Hpr [Bacillus sp. RC]MBD8114259.1 HTH-type transcriptional regulator Hpr [Priestia megaterium]MBQ4870002.1 HTH-type transcriptional regulator Hpr [Priestia megaterium]MBV6737635.1 HTH-type transcriptional regulator Hpr [Priestia megaterium]
MVNQVEDYTMKEAVFFSLKMMQMSKALWRAVEEDVEVLTKPYGINVNEYYIMGLVNDLGKPSISKIAALGSMHISTAFNFSKKLQRRGYVKLLKEEHDKRNTYIILTQEGTNLLLDILHSYNPEQTNIHKGISALKEAYGIYPELLELEAVIRLIYGRDLINVANNSLQSVRESLIEQEGLFRKNKKEIASKPI